MCTLMVNSRLNRAMQLTVIDIYTTNVLWLVSHSRRSERCLSHLRLPQIVVHSDNDHDDGVEHNVPLVAHVRVPDVGEHRVAVPRPALLHAEDEPRARGLRRVAATRAVHLRHGPH
jgi:hypothetical protein